jgi:hypothetical protein
MWNDTRPLRMAGGLQGQIELLREIIGRIENERDAVRSKFALTLCAHPCYIEDAILIRAAIR